MAVLPQSIIATLIVSLVGQVLAASDKYCGQPVFRKNGKYCCNTENAWDTKGEACSKDGSYIKIYSSCGSEGRRRKRICCEKLNAFHSCPEPAPTPAPTPAPSPTPVPSAPAPASYTSSSTRYFAGDSHNTVAGQKGACGGADLDEVSKMLAGLHDTLGMPYFAVAIAQGMGEPFMCNADESVGKGVPSIGGAGYSNVLHTHCGQCVEFTARDGKKVGGVVMDTCPTVDATGNDNSEYCSKGGAANKHGFYNHLDIHGTSSDSVESVLGDNPIGTVMAVTCPAAVTDALTKLAAASDSSSTSPVCSWYYDPNSQSWQGAPGMDDFGCSQCSDSRRLFMV